MTCMRKLDARFEMWTIRKLLKLAWTAMPPTYQFCNERQETHNGKNLKTSLHRAKEHQRMDRNEHIRFDKISGKQKRVSVDYRQSSLGDSTQRRKMKKCTVFKKLAFVCRTRILTSKPKCYRTVDPEHRVPERVY